MKDYDPVKEATSEQTTETLLYHVGKRLRAKGIVVNNGNLRKIVKAIAEDCGGEAFDELLRRAGDGRL